MSFYSQHPFATKQEQKQKLTQQIPESRYQEAVAICLHGNLHVVGLFLATCSLSSVAILINL